MGKAFWGGKNSIGDAKELKAMLEIGLKRLWGSQEWLWWAIWAERTAWNFEYREESPHFGRGFALQHLFGHQWILNTDFRGFRLWLFQQDWQDFLFPGSRLRFITLGSKFLCVGIFLNRLWWVLCIPGDFLAIDSVIVLQSPVICGLREAFGHAFFFYR